VLTLQSPSAMRSKSTRSAMRSKSTRSAMRSLLEKAAQLFENRVHLLLVDLFPSGPP